VKLIPFIFILAISCKKAEVKPIEEPKPINGYVNFKWNNKAITSIEVEMNGYTQTSTKPQGGITFVYPYGNYRYTYKIKSDSTQLTKSDTVTFSEVYRVVFLDK